jgi:hypothetical protein
VHFSGLADILVAGLCDVTFDFQPGGAPAADVVIDRVYIAQSERDDPGTPITAVPEPATLALFGSGITALLARCRRSSSRRSLVTPSCPS